MKKMFLSVLAIIGFLLSFEKILINEFVVTPTSGEYIELYNDSSVAVDVNGYILVASLSNHTFKSKSIPAGGYISFNIGAYDFNDSFTLANDGTVLKLLNASSNLLDSVGYGTYGPAPAPVYNFSCARISNTGDNAEDFNMDFTPSLGSANNCPSNGLGTGTVFINEVFVQDTSDPGVEFIELYNNSNTSVDIANWVIVCDDDYYVPASTEVPAYGYYVLYASSFPQFFYMDRNKDNIYLYNAIGERLDQVGWADSLNADSSLSVRPNGVRAYFKGFDVPTSIDFENFTPTPDAVNPVDEAYSETFDFSGIKISSIRGVGISVENASNVVGTLEIVDVAGRLLYKSNIKNMIFNANSGVYFVRINSGNSNSTVKVSLVK